MKARKTDVDALPASRDELADFVDALRDDLLRNPEEWENPTLESFLEAMAAWIRAMDGYYRNTGQQVVEHPNWGTFAEILMAAKIYE